MCSFITTCTSFTQFKLRDSNNKELFFQTEGIYEKLIRGNNDVVYSDSHEFVGPTRIYNNILKEGLEPWITIAKGILRLSEKDNPNAESVSGIISTTLDIYNVKDDSLSIMENSDNKLTEYNKERGRAYQLIFYGAPGTGKSNTIKREVDEKGKANYRTTFHPDSEYSTFVGCYKPTMKRSTITKDGVTTTEEKIVYRFEPQAFTNAYVKAWNTEEEVYLIIEEINRGNCAQIFGDLFQLLDRKNGYSEYPIDADSDLANHLAIELAGSSRTDFPTGVKEGKKLVLPPNLYIWATMNTSDQSLFPIDSAFKRRWEWKYIPIKEHKDKKYTIEIGEKKYDWWGFLERINKVIGETTSSEDKKLGYFFVKADNGIVSDEQFVGKVLFYIWNDVFKNYGFDHPIFSKGDKERFEFSDFFNADGGSDKENVQLFLKRLEESIKMDIPLDITTKKDAPTPDEETTTTEA